MTLLAALGPRQEPLPWSRGAVTAIGLRPSPRITSRRCWAVDVPSPSSAWPSVGSANPPHLEQVSGPPAPLPHQPPATLEELTAGEVGVLAGLAEMCALGTSQHLRGACSSLTVGTSLSMSGGPAPS